MIAKNKRLVFILMFIVLILLMPLIGMQFSNEVHWTLSDFIVAAVLLVGSGLLCEFILRQVKTRKHRILLLISVIVLLLVIWIELAVGLFGTPFAGS